MNDGALLTIYYSDLAQVSLEDENPRGFVLVVSRVSRHKLVVYYYY